MARKYGKLRAVPAVRHRNACVSRPRNGGSYARNNFKRDARFMQGVSLLPPAPEDVGVAPFQAHHFFPGTAQPDQQGVDFLLRQGVAGSPLAHKNPFACNRNPVQHFRRFNSTIRFLATRNPAMPGFISLMAELSQNIHICCFS